MAQVEVELEKGVATLTLNRPEALNSLTGALLAELDAAVGDVAARPEIGGVLITGAGRAFAAGADIDEISQLDATRGLEFARRGQRIFSRIDGLEKPVVAAINGYALGGGCELAMACHVRLASSRAKLGQPEVKLGILPGFGGTQRLPRLVGRGQAARLILSGQPISAEEALRIGLVDEVVDPERLQARARHLLEEMLERGPRAIAASLRAIRQGVDLTLDEGLELEARLFADCCGSDEMREGTSAFLEKRSPRFGR
ncbi:MAG: enoyl-CoA hydratase/isomerase family protein [Myxococcota bacterium]